MSAAAASSSQFRRELVMFMDWDETISAHDTLSLIAPPEGEQGSGQPFSSYGEGYMADLHTYEEEWEQGRQGRLDEQTAVGVRDDLGPAWSEQWRFLAGLDAVELTSQKRIERGGLFVGFDPVAMERRAQHVSLRPGWSDFVGKRLGEAKVEWHVISVGWSARFIGAALNAANADLPPTTICANEVELDTATGRGTGRLTKSRDAALHADGKVRPGIRTAPHKLREMRRILDARAEKESPVTVYFGDSPTDLGCLVEATVGVILGGKAGMRTGIEKAGLSRFLCDGDAKEKREYVRRHMADSRRSSSPTPPCLITGSDWHEIDGVIAVICTALQ